MIANPPPWPHGARCAAAITFDVDMDTAAHYQYPSSAPSDISYLSWGRYEEVAVPRILDIFRRHSVRQTFFAPAWVIEQYPETIGQIVEAGHELGLHGYIHEEPRAFSRDDQRYWFERSLDVTARFLGRKPRGYRAPRYQVSDFSYDLLVENGINYDSTLMGDDVPYILRTSSGDVVELPSEYILDDWMHYAYAPNVGYRAQPRDPATAMAAYEAELEAARAYGGLWIAIWHPTLSARPSRADAMERLISRMLDSGEVWLTTLEEIAEHVTECKAAGTWTPRVQSLPFYSSPVTGLPVRP